MNGEVWQVTAAQAKGMLEGVPVEYANAIDWSSHILAGIYKGKLLCLVGFIPISFFENTAYVWAHTEPAAQNHKLIFARHAKEVMTVALGIYPKIIGDCFSTSSCRWLKSLGATFLSDKRFEITHG